MKSTVTQEFKSLPFTGTLESRIGSTVTWESPRLTTMYPNPNSPKGSDRLTCRTVNGILQVKVLDKSLLFNGKSGVSVTAGLWGDYGKGRGVLVSTKYYLDGIYATGTITPGALVSGATTKGYGVPMLSSNGNLGFPVFSTFSNQAQNIYIRLSFVRDLTEDSFGPQPPAPIKIVCSGVLLAADLG